MDSYLVVAYIIFTIIVIITILTGVSCKKDTDSHFDEED